MEGLARACHSAQGEFEAPTMVGSVPYKPALHLTSSDIRSDEPPPPPCHTRRFGFKIYCFEDSNELDKF